MTCVSLGSDSGHGEKVSEMFGSCYGRPLEAQLWSQKLTWCSVSKRDMRNELELIRRLSEDTSERVSDSDARSHASGMCIRFRRKLRHVIILGRVVLY